MSPFRGRIGVDSGLYLAWNPTKSVATALSLTERYPSEGAVAALPDDVSPKIVKCLLFTQGNLSI